MKILYLHKEMTKIMQLLLSKIGCEGKIAHFKVLKRQKKRSTDSIDLFLYNFERYSACNHAFFANNSSSDSRMSSSSTQQSTGHTAAH